MTRLMQGIFNSCPSEPRYIHIWEVSRVLNYIREQLGDSQSLSLKDKSRKSVMLLALAMAARSSDLHLLDIRYMTITPNQVQFHIVKLDALVPQGRSLFKPLQRSSRSVLFIP